MPESSASRRRRIPAVSRPWKIRGMPPWQAEAIRSTLALTNQWHRRCNQQPGSGPQTRAPREQALPKAKDIDGSVDVPDSPVRQSHFLTDRAFERIELTVEIGGDDIRVDQDQSARSRARQSLTVMNRPRRARDKHSFAGQCFDGRCGQSKRVRSCRSKSMADLHFPLIAKILGPDLLHKRDIINGPPCKKRGWEKMKKQMLPLSVPVLGIFAAYELLPKRPG